MKTLPLLSRLAWRNVLRNWRHSLATLGAIAAGFTAVSVFDGFIRALETEQSEGYVLRGMLGDLIIQRPDAQHKLIEDNWAYSLDRNDQTFLDDFLAHEPAVVRRVRFLSITGLLTNGRTHQVVVGWGYDIDEGAEMRERWKWNTLAGEPLHTLPPKTQAFVLGRVLSQLVDCETTITDYKDKDGTYIPETRPFHCYRDRIQISATTEAAQVNAIEAPIVGIVDAQLREIDSRWVSMPLEMAQRLYDTDKLTMVTVKLKHPSDARDFKKRLEAAAAAKGLKFDALNWKEHSMSEFIRGGLTILHMFRNLFMLVVITIAVMSIANTMMKAVAERTREIGTLRSLGFLRKDLAILFALEGLYLSSLACTIGLIASSLIAAAVTASGLKFQAGILSSPIALKIVPNPGAWLVSLIVIFGLATGTAYLSARRAARMIVADALRHA